MKLTLATRRSLLALAQSRAFARSVEQESADLTIDELQVVTSGDTFQDRPLQDIGGKGLFIKELEEALYDKRADFAVHSIKDVPAELAPGLDLICIPKREDPRDVLISRNGELLKDLKSGARVGTSSLRRSVCLKQARPDLEVLPVRGNVDTRLRKLEEGQFDAIVLALSGLKRLGMAERATELLEVDVSLPAIGQGALGIESRAGDERVREVMDRVSDTETTICVSAERAFMKAVDGNCRMPVAAYAIRQGDEIWLRALLAETDGSKVRTGSRRTGFPTVELASDLGKDLGAELMARR